MPLRFLLPIHFTLTALVLLAVDRWLDGLYLFYAQGPVSVVYVLGMAVVTAVLAYFARPERRQPPVLPMALAGLGLALIAARVVLDRFPNSADEYAYLFQSWTYLAERLFNPPPAMGQALASDYTWVAQGKWAGQYPPGWPLILAAAGAVGFPQWAVNVVLGAVCLVATAASVRLAGGRRGALALLALSPFFVFMTGSYHSHVLAATLSAVAAWLMIRLDKRPGFWGAVALGAVVGWLGLSRYISAALLAAPLGVGLLLKPQRLRLLAGLGVGGAPFAAALLAYHKAITGDVTKPPYWLGGRTVDHLYFDGPSVLEGARISLERLLELSEWTSPLILVLAGLALWDKRKALAPADFVFPLFVAVFVFYPFDGANRYGPRYLFDCFPLLVLTLATAPWRRWTGAVLALAVAQGLATMPFLAERYHAIVEQRQDLYAQVAAKGLDNAVVMIDSGTGKTWLMELEDLARNGIDADGPVLYARGDLTDVAAIRKAFPSRRVWTYDTGVLEEVSDLCHSYPK